MVEKGVAAGGGGGIWPDPEVGDDNNQQPVDLMEPCLLLVLSVSGDEDARREEDADRSRLEGRKTT